MTKTNKENVFFYHTVDKIFKKKILSIRRRHIFKYAFQIVRGIFKICVERPNVNKDQEEENKW